ncbi:MAG: transcription termination/antitermination protein NusG [Verrucomicrobiales bacterium]
MPAIPAPRDQWFVVQVLSGMEKKVFENIKRRIQTEEMGDVIFEVLMPTELVYEVKGGKKTETRRKFFPGYLIVNMHLLREDGGLVDRSWYFFQETDGVIGFAGTKEKPLPMRAKEVEQLLAQVREREEGVRPKVQFDTGDRVRVADGPFESQIGVVEEIDLDRGKLRVSVDIFGRSTPVELEFWQVTREA